MTMGIAAMSIVKMATMEADTGVVDTTVTKDMLVAMEAVNITVVATTTHTTDLGGSTP